MVAAAKQNPQVSAPCKNNLEKVMWHIPSYIWAVKARLGFPGCSVLKNLPAYAGDESSILGLGRSPGEENGDRLQYACLGNPMNRGAWWATVHGAAIESGMT